MKQIVKKLSLSLLATILLCSCSDNKVTSSTKTTVEEKVIVHNSIYHWKTTFALDSTELNFLHRHNIDRIYLRMFDVALEQNYETASPEIVPIATTKFADSVPADCEIVPVTYITLDALRSMRGKESEYADLIVKRMKAMCSFNNCGTIKELQLDCDWTQTTKESYNALCRAVKDSLSKDDIALSVTVRLHQLQEAPPPADCAVLMLYNTGALKKYDTHNSILDIEDIKPYVKHTKYPIPFSYAYPCFGWGVKFKDKEFVSIVSIQDTILAKDEHIRIERASYSDITAVKEYVESILGKPQRGNILYHLDNTQLQNYTDNEINQILAY